MSHFPLLYTLLLGIFFSTRCAQVPTLATSQQPITITRDSLSLTVDPANGGRLLSLTYAGVEVLSGLRDSLGFQYGSVAWPSPQAEWNWPPPAAFDRDPYTVREVEEHSIILDSGIDPESGLVLRKRYRLGPASDIGLSYWFTNRSDSIRTVAAWEVTRVPYAGTFTFRSDTLRIERGNARTVETRDDRRRIVLDERQANTTKVFANVASVPITYVNQGIVLEKHTIVTDFDEVAPGQAPLEIYLNPAAGFAEFELQGAYKRLGFGETSALRTKWVIRRAGAED